MAEKVTIVDSEHAAQYEDLKRIVVVECCDRCIFIKTGAEEGGELKPNTPESDVWYYCHHAKFTGFPRRIGQKEKTMGIPAFCPLDGIVDRERAPKKSAGGLPSSIMGKSSHQEDSQ